MSSFCDVSGGLFGFFDCEVEAGEDEDGGDSFWRVDVRGVAALFVADGFEQPVDAVEPGGGFARVRGEGKDDSQLWWSAELPGEIARDIFGAQRSRAKHRVGRGRVDDAVEAEGAPIVTVGVPAEVVPAPFDPNGLIRASASVTGRYLNQATR